MVVVGSGHEREDGVETQRDGGMKIRSRGEESECGAPIWPVIVSNETPSARPGTALPSTFNTRRGPPTSMDTMRR